MFLTVQPIDIAHCFHFFNNVFTKYMFFSFKIDCITFKSTVTTKKDTARQKTFSSTKSTFNLTVSHRTEGDAFSSDLKDDVAQTTHRLTYRLIIFCIIIDLVFLWTWSFKINYYKIIFLISEVYFMLTKLHYGHPKR